jgi:hypothetical protein
MPMRPDVAVEAARAARRLQFKDFTAGGQQIKVAVHRAKAYVGHAFTHHGVQFVRCGMAGHFPQFFQNKRTLPRGPGFRSLTHGILLLKCRHFSGKIISSKKKVNLGETLMI